VADYRITESGGATEGAPAAGSAELVVDITTTGATLVANGLKVLADGVILKSQAHLTASLRADWGGGRLAVAEALLRTIEARAVAHQSAILTWPADPRDADVVERLVKQGASRRPNGLLTPAGKIAETSLALAAAGIGPVTATSPDFVYETGCISYAALLARV